MKIPALIILILAIHAKNINAIRCYVCNGQPDCNDPFPENALYKTNCDSAISCKKLVYTKSGINYAIRSCETACRQITTEYSGNPATSYCCLSDYCNHAPLKFTNHSLLIFIFIFNLNFFQ
ncbi:putative omega-scoloptoxin-Ssm1a [Brachionus plicatilis]|uniref:Putative omega-scoloptoxin-Ssm1a n=1 Tax=Brachionus plicatilis TaxID=10195 RepID=A0A3M7QKR0_BRAPC|nr:putative omega-scoloptoxin-Ssm1a [Brachionus plicatilis]